MAEIKINVDLAFSRRFFTFAGAAVLSLCAVPRLGSESLTLSTYYPAPMGVYTSLITTGGAQLARDSSTVDIGGSAAAGTRLTVMNGNVGIGTTAPGMAMQVTGVGGTNVDVHVNGRIWTDSGVWVDPAGNQFFGTMNATTVGLYNSGWRVTVGNSGNVGIGGLPASGRESLDVNGHIIGRAAILNLTLP